jgi:hypothetical protein
MAVANYFGADESDVLTLYTTGDYTPTAAEFGGSAVIADALDDAEAQVIQAMGAELWRRITDPELECLESRALAGQTIVSCGLSPIVANMVYVWRGMPSQFQRDMPQRQTDRSVEYPPQAGVWSPSVVNYGPAYNLPESAYSVAADGTITLAQAMQRDEQVFASYRVDVSDADFAMKSIGDVVASGAAAAIGSRLYPREDSGWALVEEHKASFDKMVLALEEGKWAPSELRALRWWRPVEKTQENVAGSVRRWRS